MGIGDTPQQAGQGGTTLPCLPLYLTIDIYNCKNTYSIKMLKEKRCKTALAATFLISYLIVFWTFICPLF